MCENHLKKAKKSNNKHIDLHRNLAEPNDHESTKSAMLLASRSSTLSGDDSNNTNPQNLYTLVSVIDISPKQVITPIKIMGCTRGVEVPDGKESDARVYFGSSPPGVDKTFLRQTTMRVDTYTKAR